MPSSNPRHSERSSCGHVDKDVAPITASLGNKQAAYLMSEDILPSPILLQEYEYATEGAANQLLAMAKEEQQRRLAREDAQLQFHKQTVRLGQLFGFVGFLAIVIETYILIMHHKEALGLMIFFSTLGVAFLASVCFAYINRTPLVKVSELVAGRTKPKLPRRTHHMNHDSEQPRRYHHNSNRNHTNQATSTSSGSNNDNKRHHSGAPRHPNQRTEEYNKQRKNRRRRPRPS